MARIAGVNIPQNKVVKAALTYIHGIGDKTANDICNELKIDSSNSYSCNGTAGNGNGTAPVTVTTNNARWN